MRVVRERSWRAAGTYVRVYGPRPDFAPIAHEEAIRQERPRGKNGGMRDFPSEKLAKRNAYVTVAVSKPLRTIIERAAAERGLSAAAFLGLIVEGALDLKPDQFDELISASPDHAPEKE